MRARTLQNLTVTWNGLALRFSRGSTPALQGIETTDGGADILFDGDVRLRLAPGADVGGSLAISAVAPASGASAGAPLLIPYSVTGALSRQSDGGALLWNRAGATYLLSLPSGARADEDTRVLSLPLGAGALSLKAAGITSIAAEPRAAASRVAPARAPSQRLPDEKSMPADDQVQAAVSRFLDVAYAGWTGSRFSAADGTWKSRDGSAQFSEEIGVALVAESLQRGTAAQVLPLWTDAFGRNARSASGGQLSLSTSPFVGGLPDFLKLSQPRAAALVAQASDRKSVV
jgi:hypothetical protein